MINFLGSWKNPRITKDKRFDYQRELVWDLKMESAKDKTGGKTKTIILNDQNTTDRIIKDKKVIGLIIAKIEFSFGKEGELKKWRNTFEKKISKKQGMENHEC